MRKLNSAIGKIRVQCAKDVVDSFVLATGYKKLVLLTALAALSKKSQFASKCTDTTYNTPSPKNEVCCHERHALSKYVSSLSMYLYKWCQVRLHCRNVRLVKPCVVLSIVQCKKPLPVYSFGVSLLKTREFCIERYLDCVIMLSRHVNGLEALLHSHYSISGLF